MQLINIASFTYLLIIVFFSIYTFSISFFIYFLQNFWILYKISFFIHFMSKHPMFCDKHCSISFIRNTTNILRKRLNRCNILLNLFLHFRMIYFFKFVYFLLSRFLDSLNILFALHTRNIKVTITNHSISCTLIIFTLTAIAR